MYDLINVISAYATRTQSHTLTYKQTQTEIAVVGYYIKQMNMWGENVLFIVKLMQL